MAFLQNRKRWGQTLFDGFPYHIYQAGEILEIQKGDALDALSVLDK